MGSCWYGRLRSWDINPSEGQKMHPNRAEVAGMEGFPSPWLALRAKLL